MSRDIDDLRHPEWAPCPFCGQLHGTACPTTLLIDSREYRLDHENAQLRKVLANALSAIRDWGAEEDGIPEDFGAWKAYCDGARLLGWHVYQEQAAEGADDE